MNDTAKEFGDLHWLMAILQNIDVGLVVLDRQYKVQLWNGFMENHSGISPQHAKDQCIFELFDEVPQEWLKQKIEPVFELKTRAFTIWEQRPYIFRFKNSRPITGRAAIMYQNCSIIPLESVDRIANHICMIIYDVTDIAVHQEDARLAQQAVAELSEFDHLTDLHSRSHWQPLFEREFQRCVRTQRPSSMVIFDIDQFTQINQQYGHHAGDQVLKIVADCLRQTMRQTDSACRYSSEYFAVLLVESDQDTALFFAERVRKRLSSLTIPVTEADLKITLSCGIATINEHLKHPYEWEADAEKAVKLAHEQGGNRCIIRPSGDR